MSDARLHERLAHERVNPRWSAARERAVRLRLDQALERQRAQRTWLIAAAAVVAVALAIGGVRYALAPSQPVTATSPKTTKDTAKLLLALEDGSRITPLSADARVTPLEIGAAGTTLRLDSGEARFEVTPGTGRPFRVLAPGVRVTVLGTVFRVAIVPSGVRVEVERGRVEVACWDAPRTLGAGQRTLCATNQPPPEAAPSAQEPAPRLEPSAASAPRARSQTPWRTLAEQGDYDAAFARLSAEGPSAVRDNVADLLLAADVARFSGHPADAVRQLERVLRAHAGDSRAPVAAFTLGRTLLDELGRPREAAEAFATARRLAPSGPLAQDALAREVESWSRAGEPSLARERARQYIERYPSGRRLKAVRYHGGLD